MLVLDFRLEKDGATGLDGTLGVVLIESDRLWGSLESVESQPVEAIIQTLVLPIPSIRRSSEIERRDVRRADICTDVEGGAVWSRTRAKDRAEG